jgi:hypothetical protein
VAGFLADAVSPDPTSAGLNGSLAVAVPALHTPHECARYAWEAFSGPIRETGAGSHGWFVRGGEPTG